MKSSTIWAAIGIIVLITIAYAVYLNAQLQKAKYPPAGTGAFCSPESYICGITAGGTPRCCPIPPSSLRTTQKEYCERHGGTWDGSQCNYYTEPNRIVRPRTITVVNTGGNGGNGNPAGING